MKMVWLLGVAVLILASCAPDRTWHAFVPRNALAVVLVQHPGQIARAIGASNALPLGALDGGKPWALAVVPSTPPGVVLIVALDAQPAAWTTVQAWARATAGMEAVRVGTYAVLFSPGVPTPGPLDPASRFDLTRLSRDAQVTAYVDVANLVASPAFGPALRAIPGGPVWLLDNVAGLRLDLRSRNQGLEVRFTTDGRPGSRFLQATAAWPSPVDLASWSGMLPDTNGIGAVFHLSPPLAALAGQALPEPLRHRWQALAPILGPRAAVAYSWGVGTGQWSGAVEARDPEAVRQALKTLVAGGELQRAFAAWSLDPDIPVIYRDQPGPLGRVQTELLWGSSAIHVQYGRDRVTAASGAGADEALARWRSNRPQAAWFRVVPSGAELAVHSQTDASGIQGSVRVLKDGNVEVSVWADGPSLKAWAERVPELVRGWLSAAGASPAR